jgi:hypothetical protein
LRTRAPTRARRRAPRRGGPPPERRCKGGWGRGWAGSGRGAPEVRVLTGGRAGRAPPGRESAPPGPRAGAHLQRRPPPRARRDERVALQQPCRELQPCRAPAGGLDLAQVQRRAGLGPGTAAAAAAAVAGRRVFQNRGRWLPGRRQQQQLEREQRGIEGRRRGERRRVAPARREVGAREQRAADGGAAEEACGVGWGRGGWHARAPGLPRGRDAAGRQEAQRRAPVQMRRAATRSGSASGSPPRLPPLPPLPGPPPPPPARGGRALKRALGGTRKRVTHCPAGTGAQRHRMGSVSELDRDLAFARAQTPVGRGPRCSVRRPSGSAGQCRTQRRRGALCGRAALRAAVSIVWARAPRAAVKLPRPARAQPRRRARAAHGRLATRHGQRLHTGRAQ